MRRAASGNSTWNHIPGCCGALVFHVVNVSAPPAACALWLAVTLQVGCATMTRGTEASSSSGVHDTLRAAVAARALATSAALTNDARLPKLLRTYDAIAAIH